MHDTGGQRRQCRGVHAGKVGAVAQAIDGTAHFLRRSRFFFIQCHLSGSGRLPAYLEDVMSRSFATVVFSHGKESGPWGSKITAMAAAVRELGSAVESVDYRGLDDPALRVRKL